MDINLLSKVQVGTDEFNAPVYEYPVTEVVHNVLVGEPNAQERLEELNLTGRMISYTLGIPKGDTHDWQNQIVELFGEKYLTYGIPEFGIEANIPLSWHKKVKCERYE